MHIRRTYSRSINRLIEELEWNPEATISDVFEEAERQYLQEKFYDSKFMKRISA